MPMTRAAATDRRADATETATDHTTARSARELGATKQLSCRLHCGRAEGAGMRRGKRGAQIEWPMRPGLWGVFDCLLNNQMRWRMRSRTIYNRCTPRSACDVCYGGGGTVRLAAGNPFPTPVCFKQTDI